MQPELTHTGVTRALGHAIQILQLAAQLWWLVQPPAAGNGRAVQLRGLPCNFSRLSNLQSLDLQDCGRGHLDGSTFSAGGLYKLTQLLLDNCSDVTALLDSFGSMSSLQELNMMLCKSLQSLSSRFGSFVNLQLLDLSYSYELQSLPASFGGLRSLRQLSLRNRALATM